LDTIPASSKGSDDDDTLASEGRFFKTQHAHLKHLAEFFLLAKQNRKKKKKKRCGAQLDGLLVAVLGGLDELWGRSTAVSSLVGREEFGR
jgi:hypothetical protein